MSLKDTDVKTLGDEAIAKKFKLSLAKVRQLVKVGAKHEKEHNTNISKAEQVARDHIGERPDYYKMLKKAEKTPVTMKEMNMSAVRSMPDYNKSNIEDIRSTTGKDLQSRAIRAVSDVANKVSDVAFKTGLARAPKADMNLGKSAESLSSMPGDKAAPAKDGGSTGIKNTEFNPTTRYAGANDKYTPTPGSGTTTPTTPSRPGIVNGAIPMSKTPAEKPQASTDSPEAIRDYIGRRTGQMEEDFSGVDGVRGLGFVTGDPGISAVDQYINTNALAYDPMNGAKLDFMRRIHNKLHANLGFNEYDPIHSKDNKNTVMNEADESTKALVRAVAKKKLKDIQGKKKSQALRDKLTRKMNLKELGEYDNKGGMLGAEGLTDSRSHRKNEMAEDKDPCWKGYEMVGMKKKGGRKLPNCVPVKEDNKYATSTERGIYEEEPLNAWGQTPKTAREVRRMVRLMKKKDPYNKNVGKVEKKETVKEDWQSVNRKDKTDGLSQAAVNAYRRENPGSKLKTAVTEKNPTGDRASRRKSFCSRMGGMKKRLTSAKTARDPDSRINKALRRWNCEESVLNELSADTVSNYVTGAAMKLASGDQASDRRKEQNRITGIETGVRKLHPDMYQGAVKVPANEEMDGMKPELSMGDIAKRREAADSTATKDVFNRMRTGTPRGVTNLDRSQSVNEETKMNTNQHINEALDNILEDNLSEMKDNLLVALQEKAIEKLEERKKEIAANYFAE